MSTLDNPSCGEPRPRSTSWRVCSPGRMPRGTNLRQRDSNSEGFFKVGLSAAEGLDSELFSGSEVTQAAGYGAFHLRAWHHHVEKTLLEQELAALKSIRQALTDRLFDDPGAGEAD